MGKYTIKAFEIKQPIGTFYVGVIPYDKLIEICSKDMGDIAEQNEYNIYQRRLDEKRIPELQEYMAYSKATFPNGVLLNARYNIEYKNDELIFEEREDAFFIIDGQHRIAALKEYHGRSPFEVCVIIFDKIPIEEQTEIFVTVNSEQRKVNPSVRFNLQGNDSVDTPERVIKNIARLLNEEKDSPFRRKIIFNDKPLRRGESKISLSAFMKPILRYVYDERDKYSIKDDLIFNNNNRFAIRNKNNSAKRIFWNYYIDSKDEYIYLMLLNYFTAIKDLLPNDWDQGDSLLAKTSGFNALMRLFKDVFLDNPNDMSYDNLIKVLYPLKTMEGMFGLEKIGVGAAASLRLYKEFSKRVYPDNKVNEDEALSGVMDDFSDE